MSFFYIRDNFEQFGNYLSIDMIRYEDSKLVFPLFCDNGNISLSGANNIMLLNVLKDLSENCSCFIAKCNIMQCKYII